MGRELGSQENGGRAVRAADDTDGRRFFQREAEGVGSEEGHVDAALSRGPQEDQAGLRQ